MHTIAETAKATVSPDLTQYKQLTAKERFELRKQVIKDLITSKPYGKYISLAAFSHACKYNQANGAYDILRRMVQHGELALHEEVGKKRFYTVETAVKVTYPVAHNAKSKAASNKRLYTIDQLDENAMRYQWHYENDLKGFITWLQSQN